MRKKENSHQEKGGREGKVRLGEWSADLEEYETIFFFYELGGKGKQKDLTESTISFPLPGLSDGRLGRKVERLRFKLLLILIGKMFLKI